MPLPQASLYMSINMDIIWLVITGGHLSVSQNCLCKGQEAALPTVPILISEGLSQRGVNPSERPGLHLCAS